MRHQAIPSVLFTLNRERLRARLAPHALALVQANDLLATNADGTAAYAPNSDLFYLTGVEQEESILLLAPDAHDEKQREILFLRETNETIAQWEGHKLTREEARALTGIAQVKWLSEFPSIFRGLMCEAESVYLNTNEHRRASVQSESRDERFIRETQQRYPLHRYERLARIMHALRAEKSEHELALIR
ncbi:MAG: aminopeptidase family protein, partial [Chthoniobacter sp.]|nr:aminopeptidase family protein [Chthoniobacter sp.]